MRFTVEQLPEDVPLRVAAGLVLGAGAFGAAAQLPPLRKLMTSRPAPGTGPNQERRERSWFSARFVGDLGAGHDGAGDG